MSRADTAPRVVVIGAGSHIFAAAHVPALARAGARVVGVHDADRARAAALAAEHGWHLAADLDELLAIDADIAVVTTPHPRHAEHAIVALEAGRHVLIEKPVAARPSEARRIAEAARRSGRVAAVALQHRFRREAVRARELIDSGAIGAVHRAVVVATYPKRAAYYTAAPWRGTWAGEAGGVLLNQGHHDLDLIVHLLGVPIRAFGWTRTRAMPIETEDTVEAILEWASGTLGSVHVTSAASDSPHRVEVVGTAGTLRILNGQIEVTRHGVDAREFAEADGGPFDAFPHGEPVIEGGGGGSHDEVYADLFAAIRECRSPRASAADAIAVLDVHAAIVLASASGAAVAVPPDPSAYDRLLDQNIAKGAAR